VLNGANKVKYILLSSKFNAMRLNFLSLLRSLKQLRPGDVAILNHAFASIGYDLASRNRTCTSTGNLSKLAQFINNCTRIRFKIIIKTNLTFYHTKLFTCFLNTCGLRITVLKCVL
jgi:hypothetical protein